MRFTEKNIHKVAFLSKLPESLMCVKLLTNNFLLEKAIGKSKDVHLAVLRVLPEVIRESVDAEQHADYRKGEGGKGTEGERRDAGRIVAVNQGKRGGSGGGTESG